MEQVNYYTPKAEDFHIGYEYEERLAGRPWLRCTFTEKDTLFLGVICEYLKNGHIRTPYLTAKQIEAEGWEIKAEGRLNGEFDKAGDPGIYTVHGFKGNYMFSYIGRRLTILLVDPWKEEQVTGILRSTLYSGSCPSVNEFRYICRLIGI